MVIIIWSSMPINLVLKCDKHLSSCDLYRLGREREREREGEGEREREGGRERRERERERERRGGGVMMTLVMAMMTLPVELHDKVYFFL